MSSKGWYSKQDVIKDLAEVTGKCLNNIDDHYVVGEKPPPTRNGDEDDEDLLRFYEGQKPIQSDNMEKPDLAGITQMLRMVDNYYEKPNRLLTSDEEHIKSKTEPPVIVSISKLNPNVNEFTPGNISQKSVIASSSIHVESKISKNEFKVLQDVSVSNMVDAKETIKTDYCDINLKTNISDNRIDISQLLSNKLKEMREQLKTKICDTSKVKCVKLRRERNLAIASLLKLYCQQPPSDENRPNLISPDYFKNNLATKSEVTAHNNVKIVSKSNTDDNFIQNNLNVSSDAEIINKEIAASVEKVTRWLHSSEPDKMSEHIDTDVKETTPNITEMEIPIKKPTKSRLIHLGPVTFKRKTNNNHSMSPVSLQSDNSKTKSETFVPSVYASELTKRYIQQSKKKQEAQNDIWKNLENQLKEKDEAIKKQRLHTVTFVDLRDK